MACMEKLQPEFEGMFLDVKYFWSKEIVFPSLFNLYSPTFLNQVSCVFYALVVLKLTANTMTIKSKNQVI